MKIAVYSIAKDEEANVAGWYESAREADHVLLLDTGSTDGTTEAARGLGIDVHVEQFNPWRFDVARNAALSLLPPDIDMCIALDLDERLQPGWREALEAVPEGVTRPRYRYTWSWDKPGVPGLQYAGDKIHARHGYSWRHPVHEVLYGDREQQAWCGLEIHHYPDAGKSRGQYRDLLAVAVAEDPDDDRNAHYYARELFFAGDTDAAKAEFERHLSLPTAVWGPERAQSCRYLYRITNDVHWLYRAVEEAPERREAWLDLARAWHDVHEWALCLDAATKGLSIKERHLEYLSEAEAWGPWLADYAAISAYRLGYFHEARARGVEALRLSPYDERLAANLRFYEEAVA